MKDTNNFALIMAGGVGSRFWPTSRANYPKQFQDLTGVGRTLLQQTYDRLEGIVPSDQVYILTNSRYRDLVQAQLPEINNSRIICEPAMRNTAACILYAALKINQRNSKSTMIVLPSDHFISKEKAFRTNVMQAFERASTQNELLTFGIPPNSPHTGYGYLEVEDKTASIGPIVKFTEKPTQEKAEKFLQAGNYFWNSGIFVWSSTTILNAFATFQPEMLALFEAGIQYMNTSEEEAFLAQEYPKAEDISIDYAILEKATNIAMVKASFFWNDLGTWTSLYDQLSDEKSSNVNVKAQLITEEATGNMVYTTGEKIVVIKGLKDFVIVDEGDVLLIYPKGEDQSVKALRKKTTEQFGDKLG